MSDQFTPEQALDRLEALHTAAADALRGALERFVRTGVPPTPEQREKFRYPELRLTWQPAGQIPFTRRAWAKFQVPGVYVTTVTQPAFFRRYLLEQLHPLVAEYGATIDVTISDQEVPYPYVLEPESEIMAGAASPADLARHFPTPMLSTVGDEVADGLWVFGDERLAGAGFERRARRLFVTAAGALHRDRLASRSAMDPADQLSTLCRPIRAAWA